MAFRDDPGRSAAVRGVVSVTAAASGAFLLLRAGTSLPAEPGADPWSGGVLAPAVTAATVALVPLLVVTLARTLAHPRRVRLPARSAQAAATGAAAQLVCVAVALAAVLAGRVLPAPDAAMPSLGADLTAAGLAVVTALATTAGVLRWRRAVPALVALPADALPARPDLADDAASLVVRITPGTSVARGAQRLNRHLDDRRSRRPGGRVPILPDPATALRLLALVFRLSPQP